MGLEPYLFSISSLSIAILIDLYRGLYEALLPVIVVVSLNCLRLVSVLYSLCS